MADETHTFAVETTAQIEVLTSAITALLAVELRKLPPPKREAVLRAVVKSASEVPSGAPFPTLKATRFFEAVAAALLHRAERFVANVRNVLED